MSCGINRVMLLNPANTMPKDSVRRLATPLGFLYIGTVLKNAGYDVKILDSTCEGYYNTRIDGNYLTYGLSDEEVTARIREYAPDIVGITSMFTAHQRNAIRHCELVKSVDRNIPVVIGGIHPSLTPEKTIKENSVDYVILGEGEYRFLHLIGDLNKGKDEFEFDGIAYKKGGQIKINPMTTRIENLDELPIPDRSLVDIEKYIRIGVPYAPFPRRERVEQIMASRGCPGKCVFCSTVAYWGKKFRTRSVDNIIKEVEELVNKYGIEEIQFLDDNLTANKGRIKELFRRLKKYNLSWCTPHGLMTKTIDDEMIDLMADSGAYQITFAIESGSKRVLEEIIHKDVPPREHVRKLVESCHNKGIQVHGLFVVGFPGEKRSELEETLNYPFGVGFDSISIFIANPVPGSELYAQCKKKGYLDEEKYQGDFKSADIRIPTDSPEYMMPLEELVEIVDGATKKYNEFSKNINPGAWDAKFKQFLSKHGDKADLLLGRVT